VLLVMSAMLIAVGAVVVPIAAAAAGCGPKSRGSAHQVVHTRLTRQRLMDMTAAQEAHMAPYVIKLKAAQAPAARAMGQRLEAEIQAARVHAAALPARGTSLDVPVVAVPTSRGRSASAAVEYAAYAAGPQPGYSTMTWAINPRTGSLEPKDPITNFFAAAPGFDPSLGSAAAIRADVESPNSVQEWWDTGGGYQYTFICYDIVAGLCDWHLQDYQVQWLGTCISGQPCGLTHPTRTRAPRYHARLFDALQNAGVEFTIVGAHHDNQGHRCTDDWTMARSLLAGGIPNGDIWASSSSDSGNAGWYQCASWDGQELNLWLQGHRLVSR